MKEYEIEKEGAIYTVLEYPDGRKVKTFKGKAVPKEDILDNTTQVILEMAANIEYLTMLKEMEVG